VINQLRQHGSVERGWLGVQIQSVTIAKSLGMDYASGALVIIEVNGKRVENAKKLSSIIANTEVGKSTQLGIWRHGSKKTIKVILGRMSGEKNIVLS